MGTTLGQRVTIAIHAGAVVAVDIRATAEDLADVPRDIARTWTDADQLGERATSDEERATAIGIQCTCALIQCALSTLSQNQLPDLLAAQVKEGQVSRAEALAWVERMTDYPQRTESLLAIAPLASPPLSERLLAVLRSMEPYQGGTPFWRPEGDAPFWMSEDYYVSEVLQVMLLRPGASDGWYINTLARLTPFLNPAVRGGYTQEVSGNKLLRGC